MLMLTSKSWTEKRSVAAEAAAGETLSLVPATSVEPPLSVAGPEAVCDDNAPAVDTCQNNHHQPG